MATAMDGAMAMQWQRNGNNDVAATMAMAMEGATAMVTAATQRRQRRWQWKAQWQRNATAMMATAMEDTPAMATATATVAMASKRATLPAVTTRPQSRQRLDTTINKQWRQINWRRC
jgi:hypothetical protein